MDLYGATFFRHLTTRLTQVRRLVAGWGPAIDLPLWLSPGIMVASVLALVIASGIALASVATLLVALLVAYLLLDRVFGLSIAVA